MNRSKPRCSPHGSPRAPRWLGSPHRERPCAAPPPAVGGGPPWRAGAPGGPYPSELTRGSRAPVVSEALHRAVPHGLDALRRAHRELRRAHGSAFPVVLVATGGALEASLLAVLRALVARFVALLQARALFGVGVDAHVVDIDGLALTARGFRRRRFFGSSAGGGSGRGRGRGARDGRRRRSSRCRLGGGGLRRVWLRRARRRRLSRGRAARAARVGKRERRDRRGQHDCSRRMSHAHRATHTGASAGAQPRAAARASPKIQPRRRRPAPHASGQGVRMRPQKLSQSSMHPQKIASHGSSTSSGPI